MNSNQNDIVFINLNNSIFIGSNSSIESVTQSANRLITLHRCNVITRSKVKCKSYLEKNIFKCGIGINKMHNGFVFWVL